MVQVHLFPLPSRATICPTQAFDSPYLHLPDVPTLGCGPEPRRHHGGKLVIDRVEGSENKSQQHRFIPQDSGQRRCLDSERHGEFTSPLLLLHYFVTLTDWFMRPAVQHTARGNSDADIAS